MVIGKSILANTIMMYLLNIAKIVFPLVTLPYLARVLSIECFGFVAFVKALMQYCQIGVDFGYDLSATKAIVQIRNNKDKMDYFVGDLLVSKLIVSGVVFVILCSIVPFLRIITDYLYVILSFVVVVETCFLFDFFFRGIEKMEAITIRFLIMKGIAAALTFVVVKSDEDILWIPILDVIGSIVAAAFVFFQLRKFGIKLKFSGLKLPIHHIKDSFVYFLSNFATTAFGALNTIFVGLCLSTSEVAYWSMCFQIVGGIQALYSPITSALYPHMAKYRDFTLLLKVVKICMPLVLVGNVVIYFWGDCVLLILGGVKYRECIDVLRAMIPLLILSFPAMLFGWPALGVIDKQREATTTTVVTGILQTIGIFLLWQFDMANLINLAVLRGVTELIMFLFRFYYCSKFRNLFATT